MKDIKNALVLFLFLTIATGVVYPVVVTLLSAGLFPHAAAGSPAYAAAGEERVVGSELLGQSFAGPGYFHGRPSVTPTRPYNPQLSLGSNQAASNPALAEQAAARVAALRASDPGQTLPIPADLVTASASGLDPDISLAAARWQAPRVARERSLEPAAVETLIRSLAQPRRLLFLGEPRVNVLALNLALDRQAGGAPAPRP